MRARKKPVEIEFFWYDGDLVRTTGEFYVPDWARDAFLEGILFYDSLFYDTLQIKTDTGIAKAEPGDYIIKGTKGEIYPCKKEVFEEVYEVIDEFKNPIKDWLEEMEQFLNKVRDKGLGEQI